MWCVCVHVCVQCMCVGCVSGDCRGVCQVCEFGVCMRVLCVHVCMCVWCVHACVCGICVRGVRMYLHTHTRQ